MFKNFFKVTLRSLLKSKLFVFVNIVGLGLSLACCIVAYLNFNFGAMFDTQHENYDELYQVSIIQDRQGAKLRVGAAPMALGPYLKQDIPGIKAITRFDPGGITIKKDNNLFNRRIAFVDDDFMDMFTFPMKYGDKYAFKDLSKLLIDEQTATALFGDKDPTGETVEVILSGQPSILYTIGGVFQDVGQQSTLQFRVLTHFENYHRYRGIEKGDWEPLIPGLFVQCDEATAQAIPDLIQKYAAPQSERRKDLKAAGYWVQSMDEIPLNQRDLNYTWLGAEALHPAHQLAPIVMAILILLLACFNFTNTAIAMSNKRLKEIGVRKTVGGSRQQLIFQFLGENVLLCFMSLVVGILFANWLVPYYSDMWPNMDLTLSLTKDSGLIIFLGSVLLFTALMAGGYPAFFVSRFKPVEILRGTLRVGSSSILSKVLLGFQFVISVIALIGGFAFLQNSEYQKSIDLGYDKESMIIADFATASEAQNFKAAIAQNPIIQEIATTDHHIGWGTSSASLKSADVEANITIMNVGMNYLETSGMKVLKGRGFTPEFREADRQNGVIVNERAVARFGWDDALGKELFLGDSIRYVVRGVVKDFYIYGLWGSVNPTMLRLRNDDENDVVVAKVDPAQLGTMDDFFKEKWAEVVPDRPSDITIHNQDVLGEAREINGNILVIFAFLAVIAVILSAIGLFTLVSINILSRVKEIGVRKVLGASIVRIATLINRPFLFIVGIAAILGGVGAYFLTDMLMGSIWTYYQQMNLISFLVPTTIMLAVAFLSVSGKVIKAARRNPVESLRYE